MSLELLPPAPLYGPSVDGILQRASVNQVMTGTCRQYRRFPSTRGLVSAKRPPSPHFLFASSCYRFLDTMYLANSIVKLPYSPPIDRSAVGGQWTAAGLMQQ